MLMALRISSPREMQENGARDILAFYPPHTPSGGEQATCGKALTRHGGFAASSPGHQSSSAQDAKALPGCCPCLPSIPPARRRRSATRNTHHRGKRQSPVTRPDTSTHFSRLPPEAGFKGAGSPFGGCGVSPLFPFFSRRLWREKIKRVFRGHSETPSGDSVPCTPAEVGEIENLCRSVSTRQQKAYRFC